jgi:NAD(P)H-dependent FMN reductase
LLKVVGLLGSPRRGGNSEILLDQALAGAIKEGSTVEKIIAANMDIYPCRGCESCFHTAVCAIQDDMQSIHHKLKEADHLILSSPIYFMSLPAQIKVLIDRCQALWAEKYILNKRRLWAKDGSQRRGLWIAVAGRKNPYFEPARAIVKAFFTTLDIEYGEELLFPGIDAYQQILNHPTALKDAFQAGGRLIAIKKAMK